MHRRAVARLEVKHPGAKVIGAEELNISELVLARLIDLLLQADEFHGLPSSRRIEVKLLQIGFACQLRFHRSPCGAKLDLRSKSSCATDRMNILRSAVRARSESANRSKSLSGSLCVRDLNLIGKYI